jgi:hypothetical protein
MKKEEINLRITPTLKKEFQDICEFENTTMSNKIQCFILTEVKTKKIKTLENRVLTKRLIKFGVMNGNGRLYQKSELTKIKIDDDGIDYTELNRLNKQTLYGQFGYLENGELIHKYNATHSISNLRFSGDWLIGDITILNDSIIPILDKLIFRPRSFGTLDDKGVVRDLEIIGFDALIKTEDKFYDDGNEDL